MITINLYLKYDKKMIFKVIEKDIDKITSRKYWKIRIRNLISEHSEFISNAIHATNPDDMNLYFNLEHLGELNVKLIATMEELATSRTDTLFAIQTSNKENNITYSLYVSENSYRNIKQEYILDTFWRNQTICQDKNLRAVTEPNRVYNNTLVEHDSISIEDIEWLENFELSKQTLDYSYLVSEIERKIKEEDTPHTLIEYKTKTNDISYLINSNDDLLTDKKFICKYDDLEFIKINSFFNKEDRSHNNYGIFVDLKEAGVSLYYEPEVGKNNLCVLHIESEPIETHFSFNLNLNAFILFVFFMRDNLSFFEDEKKQDFHYPQLNLLDRENVTKLYKYIKKEI